VGFYLDFKGRKKSSKGPFFKFFQKEKKCKTKLIPPLPTPLPKVKESTQVLCIHFNLKAHVIFSFPLYV